MREPTSTEQSQKELVQGLFCGGEPALHALCALLGRVPAHRHLGKLNTLSLLADGGSSAFKTSISLCLI